MCLACVLIVQVDSNVSLMELTEGENKDYQNLQSLLISLYVKVPGDDPSLCQGKESHRLRKRGTSLELVVKWRLTNSL